MSNFGPKQLRKVHAYLADQVSTPLRSWCGGQGPGSRVQGPGSRVKGPGSRVQGPGSRVKGPGSRVQGSGPRVLVQADLMFGPKQLRKVHAYLADQVSPPLRRPYSSQFMNNYFAEM